MADTLTANYEFIKPETDSVAWHTKVNANSDSFDTILAAMAARLTAVETAQGAADLPFDANWTTVLDAQSDADAGDTIRLPNAPITQTSTFDMNGKEVNIIGSGPLSAWVCGGDLSLEGSTMQIRMTNVDGVIFKGFELRHTRNATNRMLAFDLQGNCRNVTIENMHGVDLTSDFVIMRSYATAMENILIRNNLIDEWYESVFNIHAGRYVKNIYCLDNVGNVTTAHPNAIVSRPYGCLIAPEDGVEHILAENVVIANNQFYAVLADPEHWSNSVGIAVNGTIPPCTWCLDGVYVHNNVFSGFQRNFFTAARHEWNPGAVGTLSVWEIGRRGKLVITKNTFSGENAGSSPILFLELFGQDTDRIDVNDNELIGFSALPVLDLGDTGNVVINQEPPNIIRKSVPDALVAPTFTESFNTADQGTPGPDLGWSVGLGTIGVVGNKAQSTTAATPAWARMTSALSNADEHWASAVIDCAAEDETALGVFIGKDNSATFNCYAAMIHFLRNRLVLFRVLDGVGWGPLGNYTLTATPGTPITLALRRRFNQFDVWVNGSPVLYAADNTPSLIGATFNYTGIIGWSDPGTAMNWESFQAGA